MDDVEIERLVERSAAGDAGAWRALFVALLPGVERRVRGSRSFVGFRDSEDDVRDVVTTVFERLRRDDCRALRLYAPWRERHPDKSFADWLTIVLTNVIRDFVSDQLVAGDDGVNVRALNTIAEVVDVAELGPERSGGRRRPGSATLTSVNQLADAAARKLTAVQVAVLDDWLQGFEFDEVATRRQLASGRDAEKHLRAALARLRRHVDG